MLNVNEIRYLEDRWKKYRRKKSLKILFYIFLLLVMLIAIVLYPQYFSNRYIKKDIEPKVEKNEKKITNTKYLNKTSRINHTNNKNKNTTIKSQTIDNNITDTAKAKDIVLLPDKKKSIVDNTHLSKSGKSVKRYDKILMLDRSFLNHIYDKNIGKADDIPKENIKKQELKPKEKDTKHIKKEIENKRIKKTKIIISSRRIDKLQYLKDRYNETGKAMYAVMISKEYYKRKMYKKSLAWAITANNIDSLDEESWIMFAKSSIKIGKKEEAINALRAFIKVNSSKKITMLLSDIENGVFK